jgi:hypothetical protein
MKTALIIAGVWLGLNLSSAEAQIIKDPLRDYYQGGFSQVDFSKENIPDEEGPSPPVTPQTQIYYFAADFPGDGRKSLFITSEQATLGAHAQYAWSIYCPVSAGGFRLITNSLASGLGGFDYIGYIDEIKKFGIITGSKYAVVAYYLDDGVLKSQAIDRKRGHDSADYYPKYFHAHVPDYHITTITLAELIQKYAK